MAAKRLGRVAGSLQQGGGGEVWVGQRRRTKHNCSRAQGAALFERQGQKQTVQQMELTDRM